MTILVFFHAMSYKKLKYFYLFYVDKHLTQEFPYLVSYDRLIQLQKRTVVAIALFLKTCSLDQCTTISIIDSTPLRVCYIRREKQHKKVKNLAIKEHTSTGKLLGNKGYSSKNWFEQLFIDGIHLYLLSSYFKHTIRLK